jgi:hypothetical protein
MPQQDPIKPGQVTSLPQNTYDPNAEAGKVTSNLPYVAPPTAPNLLFNNTAPTTPTGATGVNPAYALYINTLKNNNAKREFLSTPYYTPNAVAERYSDNSIGGYHPYDMNLENWYGDNQSWYKQWGNRIGKTGTKALGSFANALLDIPNMINAASQGSLAKMWDNPVNNWSSDLMEWSEKAMPNYETNWEREHPFANLIPFYGMINGGSAANSWGKVFENMGFTIGAVGGAVVEDLAIGAMTGGVGEIPVAAMQINKAVYKLGRLFGGSEELLSGLKASIKNADDIVRGLKGIDRFNYALRKGAWGANMIMSGMGEAAFEGIESYKTLNQDLQQQFLEENGRMPTYEDSQKIDKLGKDAANTRFLFNTALLAVTNSIQWGNLLRPLNATKDLIEAEAKQGVSIALKEGSKDVFEAANTASKLARWGKKVANNKIVDYLIGSSSEGVEEGSQYAIETGVNDFYKRKYNEKNITTANNFIKSFSTGMSAALGTREGWENIMYGILGGAMYKAGEGLYYKARGVETSPNYKKKLESVLQGLNSVTLTGMFENKYGEAVNAISIQEDMQRAAATGDIFQYKNYKHDQFVNFVLSGLKQNKFETRMDQLNELKKMDGEEFEQMFGIPSTTENKKTVDEYVAKLQQNAMYMKDIYKRVSRTFVNPYQLKGTGNYKNKEEAAKQDTENAKHFAYEEVKEDLVRTMSIAKDSSDRIRDVNNQITDMQSVLDPATVLKLSSEEGLKDLKKEYEQKLKLADDSLALANDPKVTADVKWYTARIADLEAIENSTDNKEKNIRYNQLRDEVADHMQKEKNLFYSISGTADQQTAVEAPFPRDVLKETITLGQDVYHLQKRNEEAIDRYARLTTKGGFKKLFDAIDEARKLAAELEIPLAPEAPTGQAAQQQAAFNAAQTQQGQTPTAQPQDQNPAQTQTAANTTQGTQQGYLEDLGLDPDQSARRELVGYLVDAIDGKIKLSEEEALHLGFQTIDDIKVSNPKVNMDDYVKVKTTNGRNYYVLKAAVEEGRKFLGQSSITQVSDIDQQIRDIVLTDENYKNWSNKGDKSDYQQFVDQVEMGLNQFDKVADKSKLTADNINLSLQSNKAFSNKTIRENVSALLAQKYAQVQETTPPVTPPPATGATTGALRTEDFAGKVFIPNDLKEAFNNAVFSGTKDAVKQNLSITVRALDPKFQDNYNTQQANKSFSQVPGFPGVYSSAAPIDLSILHNGNIIGKISYPKRLLFKIGNAFVNIDKLTPEQYQNMTGKPAAQHAADVDEFNKQVAFTNFLAQKFKNNNLQEISISPKELNDLIDVNITYGELDYTKGAARPAYNTLVHNTVSFPGKNGNVNAMVILSVPKRYSGDTMVRERTGFSNAIYGQAFYDGRADDTIITDYTTANVDKILNVGTRYVGITQKPDGTFALIGLHPQTMDGETLNGLFDTLKERSALAANTNIIAVATKEESEGELIIGDNEVMYYKLPSDAAKSFNDDFNTNTNNQVFIADPNGRVFYELSVSPVGTIRLDIHEPKPATEKDGTKDTGFRARAVIYPQKMANIKNVSGLISALNTAISKEAAKTTPQGAYLKSLNLSLNATNFKTSIANDNAVANAEEIAGTLTASTNQGVFTNGTMRILPNSQNVQKAYVAEKGNNNQQTPEKTKQATIPVTTTTGVGMFAGLTTVESAEPDFNTIDDLFGPVADLNMPTSGMFAGLSTSVTDTGGFVEPITPNESTSNNQEDIKDIAFGSVKEALNSLDIDYRTVGDAVQFFTLSTGEVLDIPETSPRDLVNDMGLTVVDKQKSADDTPFDFMLATKDAATMDNMMNFETARAYVESILPSFISIEDLNTVMDKIREQGIENPETDVWGAFKGGIIYLNSQSPNVGQEFHEAFHAVFNMFLSPEEQSKLVKYATEQLYTKLKKEGSSIREYVTEQRKQGVWKDISEKEAVDKAAEEWMAEEFRNWNNKKKSAGVLDKLFDLIQRFFKWLTRSGSDLDALFNKINRGGYKYSNLSSGSFLQETTDDTVSEEFQFMLVPARPSTMKIGTGTRTIKRNLDSKTSKQVVQNVASYFEIYKKTGEYEGVKDDALLDTVLNDLALTYDPKNALYAGMNEEQLGVIGRSDENFIYTDPNSRKIIKDAAKKYINSMNYFEQFNQDELNNEEDETGSPATGYDNRTENVGGFSSLPGMLRHYIGFTSYEATDRFGNTKLANGKPVIATVDAISVYYGLLRATANINDPVKFFQRMIRFADNNEQSRHFVKKFIKDTGLNEDALFNQNRLEATTNKALVEQVKKGFNKYRIDYVFTEYDMAKARYRSYPANRRNVENVQFDKWSNNFIAGYSESDANVQGAIRRAVDGIRNKYFDEKRAFARTADETAAMVSEVRNVLNSVGIQLSYDFIKYSLLSINANRYDTLNKDYLAQGAELQFDDPANEYISKSDYNYVQIMKVADEISLNKGFMDELSKVLHSDANPFFRKIKDSVVSSDGTVLEEGETIDTAMVTRIINVAKGNALFDETVGESSFTNADNKVVFAHQDGTFNVKYTYQLRDAEFRRQLREQGYREQATAYMDKYDSEWLTDNFLLKSEDFEAVADNLLYQNIDGMRVVETNKAGKVITEEFRDQKDGVTYGSFSPREFMLNTFNFYISYAKSQKTAGKDVVTTPHLIRVLEASKTGATVNLPMNLDVYRDGTVTEKTLNQMVSEVTKEYNRISRVQNEIGKITENIVENYHTGSFAEDGYTITKGYRGLQFTDNMTSLLSGATVRVLQDNARSGVSLTEGNIETIKQELKNSLNKMVDDTIGVMESEGIIKRGEKGNYQNVLLHADFMSGNAQLNLQSVSKDVHFKNNIGHVLINDYLNTMAYNQILHGDAALSLKNDGGIDAVKRAKGDNAAITSIRTDLLAPELGITKPFTHSSVAIFKEPTSADKTKIADAQMYTTVEGLRYALWGLGRLSPRLAKFLDVLEDGGDIHNIPYQVTTKEGKVITKTFDGVFDEDGGIYTWDEMTNSLKLVFKDGKAYFKMSVVVLQPDLTSFKDERTGEWKTRPGWETLDALRRKMEADSIHFAAPESASKMMTLDVSKAKDFSDLKGHLFDNQYFGLQTENPSNKLEITTPTQLVQLIDSEQVDSTEVYFQGEKTTVGKLKEIYQNAVSQKATNAYESALNEIYELKDFNGDVDQAITEGKVTPRLARFYKRVASTLEASGGDAQLLDFYSLDENGNIKFNANLSAIKTKSQQLYLAYFSKGVLSQKNPGYTVALLSGIDTKTVRRATKIVDGKVVNWEYVRREQWDTNHRGVQGERIHRTRDQVTEVGQIFLDELQHMKPKYNDQGEIIGYASEMMLPAHFVELLGLSRDEPIPAAIAEMFGVRIPSQDKHSFISLELIDFLPANLGSTGMFPKELIKLSGADFDIDKLFITRPDFYTETSKTGKTIYKKYGEATTPEEKWSEYKTWMAKNNKAIKGIIGELAGIDPAYQSYLLNENPDDVAAEILGVDVKQRYIDNFTKQALAQLKLPSTLEEFTEASKDRELNNGVLNNRILDSYRALLTNTAMHEIAATPASLNALTDLKDNDDISMTVAGKKVSVFGKKVSYPVDSMIGKYYGFKNNTTGKNNIGIDVNANLIYSVLNKGEVRLEEKEGIDSTETNFFFDNVEYNSFAGDREYNLETKQFDGKRTNDVLSTLITSATDEAKEQLNALYNLGVDALKVVNYLVALKVPLKTAVYFVNQPSVRNYLNIKGIKQNTVQTQQEDKGLNRTAFRDAAIDQTKAEIKDYKDLSDDEMFVVFENSGLLEVRC